MHNKTKIAWHAQLKTVECMHVSKRILESIASQLSCMTHYQKRSQHNLSSTQNNPWHSCMPHARLFCNSKILVDFHRHACNSTFNTFSKLRILSKLTNLSTQGASCARLDRLSNFHRFTKMAFSGPSVKTWRNLLEPLKKFKRNSSSAWKIIGIRWKNFLSAFDLVRET